MKMPPTESNPKELLAYWINERENIRHLKYMENFKPWSDDPIFQKTYFTNVHREDDKVTKFIRKWVQEERGKDASQVVFNLIACRLINWPDTIEHMGYWNLFDPEMFKSIVLLKEGKVWGSAYIVSTCGQRIDKVTYMAELLAEIQYKLRDDRHKISPVQSCKEAHKYLLGVRGLSDFMAAQIVADIKHTPGMGLCSSPDFYTFAKPGPGSLRGLAWYFELDKVRKGDFTSLINQVHEDLALDDDFEMQDLQNCLCEFDKYMRIKNGTGRSKRLYDGV